MAKTIKREIFTEPRLETLERFAPEIVRGSVEPKNIAYEAPSVDTRILEALIPYARARRRIDPYALPGYFIMTGRNGLAFVSKRGGHFPVCNHPNRPERLLVFPPKGNLAAVDAYLESLDPWPVNGVQLARFSAADAQAFTDDFMKRWNIRPFVEDTLDWGRYPIRNLPVATLAVRSGKSFQNHRRKYNYAHRHIAKIEVITDWNDEKNAKAHDFIHDWARKKHAADARFDLYDYVAPYLSILSIHAECDLRSICLLFEDQAGAVMGMVVVEILDRVAAAYMNIAVDAVPYLSSYILMRACEYLHETQAADLLCLGGSEQESLDTFKANVQPDVARNDPHWAYGLHSFSVDPR